MDKRVPDRFSTPRADIDIVTRAARALAVLTKSPTKGAGSEEIGVDLQTGIRCSDRSILPSFCEGPFTALSMDVGGGAGAVVGRRYFIHSLTMTARNTAAEASTGVNLACTVGGATVYLGVISLVPSVANSASFSAVVDILCDVNTALNFNNLTANPAYAKCTVAYQFVGGV